MTLVTGASGFIGGHVARALAARGEPLRLLLRTTSSKALAAELAAEVVEGDLRDLASLRRAVDGCRRIFHVAADYRLWAPRPAELYESNVEGTRNLLTAAAEAGCDRFVYTSTVGTIGVPGDGETGDEASPVSLDDMSGHYKRSKFLAEEAVCDAAWEGFPAVIVNPTAPVGEADAKPTPTGRIIVDFLCGRMPAYVDTGLNLVDVEDVAAGHLLAAERGRPGERYILGGRNMSLREILETLARLTDREPPWLEIPYGAAWAVGAVETAVARFTGRAPQAPIEAVRMARKKMYVRTDKAERELGYRARPVEPALERAIRWFQANGYC